MRRCLIFSTVPVFLFGCIGPSAVYQRLREIASAPIDSSWVEERAPSALEGGRIDTRPVFTNLEELKLDAFVAEVLLRNPTLVAAEHAWRAALARYPQVTSLEDPMLSYALGPSSIGSSAVDFAQKIELSQKLPSPGKLGLRGEAALSEAQARREDLQAAKDNLAQQAKVAFFEYYYIYRAIETNEVNKAILQEFKRTAEAKYAAGTTSKQDALQAEVAYNHVLHRGIVLERMRRLARGRMNTLLNRSPQAPLPPPPGELPLPAQRPEYAILLGASLKSRPEIRALMHRLRGQQATLDLAVREYWPDVIVSAGYNSFWQEEDLQPYIGLGLNIPIQTGRRRGAVDESTSEIFRLRARLSDLAANVALEVQDAFERVVEGEHVVELYRSHLVPAAEENLEAARSEYAVGRADFLSLLTAERSLVEAQLEFHRAVFRYHQSLADLERVVGAPLLSEDRHENPN